MPPNNRRVNVVLGRPLYDALVRLARRAERERIIDRTATLTHDAVWRRRLRRK